MAEKEVSDNVTYALPKIIRYKNCIQKAVIGIAVQKELQDVRDCKINQSIIDKLCFLAKKEWEINGDAQSLYCAAMAVATIVKEYGWGTQYLIGDGIWQMADRIQKS